MNEIKWGQTRTVVESVETGEHYVRLPGGLMLASEYVSEGGSLESYDEVGEVEHIKCMTNAELQEAYA